MTPSEKTHLQNLFSCLSLDTLKTKLKQWDTRCNELTNQTPLDSTLHVLISTCCGIRDLLQEEIHKRTLGQSPQTGGDPLVALAARHMQWLAKSDCILVGQPNNWRLWTTEGGVRWVFEAKTLKDCITKAMETAP